MTYRQAVAYALLKALNTTLVELEPWMLPGPKGVRNRLGVAHAKAAYLRLCDQAEGSDG